MGLARGATIALLINATGVALGFAAKVVLARILGPEQFGVYAYVLAWVTVLSLLATLGYGDAIMRFAPAYRVQERWGLLRGLVRYAEASILIAGLGIFAVGAAVVMLLASQLASGLWQTFLLGLAAIPILALAQTRSCLARSFGRVFSALAPNATVQRLTIIVVVPLFALVLRQDIGPAIAMVITLFGAFLALLLLTFSIRSAYPVPMRSAPIADDRALWRRTSLQLLLVAGTQQCMS